MSSHESTVPTQGITGLSIRDYFLDNAPKAYSKAACSYDVVLQNNTDFIISRRTSASCKELVILISKGQFYFKNAKSGTIEDVTPYTLKSYFRDLKNGEVYLEQVKWLPEINKQTIERIADIISRDTFVDMCRHNVTGEIHSPDWYAGYWEQNSKLFIKLYSIFPTISDEHSNKYRSSMPVIFELEKRYGYNEAIYFAETLLQSGIGFFTSSAENRWFLGKDYYQDRDVNGFIRLLDEPYCLNLRRLIDYIFFDAYSQGITSIDTTFWGTYTDYLDMQLNVFGKIREKYPRSLKTEHDVIALKANLAAAISKHEGFSIRSAEISELAYQGKTFSIIVPDTPQQIADEGINLSHCVGGYIDLIIDGGCHILFLRRTRTQDQSLVTLHLCRGRIIQAEGSHRRKILADERKFLNTWGMARNIQIAV